MMKTCLVLFFLMASVSLYASDEVSITLTSVQRESPLLKTTTAQWNTLDKVIDVLGAVASDTDQVFPVRPSSSGHIEEFFVSIGDAVHTGQALLRYQGYPGEAASIILKATHAGVIVGVYADKGDHVDPFIPVFSIADMSRVRCIFDIFEKDIHLVIKGQHVQIRATAYPDDAFEGDVTYISPRVDENSRTVKVRVDLSNPHGKLKFGMFLSGGIHVGSRRALLIPEASVQSLNSQTVAFVLKNQNTVVVRPVELGEKFKGQIEIKSGLKEGETVISQGSFILKNEFLTPASSPES